MSSFLIKALLSQCTDVDRVLEGLCWSGSSWPEPERVESLSALIEELILRPSPEDLQQVKSSRLQEVVWDQCVPLLRAISSQSVSSQQHSEIRRMLNAVCGLLGVCVSQCEADVVEKIANITFSAFCNERSGDKEEHLDIDIAVEVLAVLLADISHGPSLATKALSCTLSSIKELSEAQVSKVIVRVWFTALRCATQEKLLQHIWEDLLNWHEDGAEVDDAVSSRVLLCLTAVSDHVFNPLEQKHQLSPDPLECQAFFRVIQAGLEHRDNVSRKRALYLLKRCVSVSKEVHAGVGEPGESGFRTRKLHRNL